MAGTLNPKWNQSFFYSPVKRRDLQTQQLQITVYDYDRIGSGEYVGEVNKVSGALPITPYELTIINNIINSG